MGAFKLKAGVGHEGGEEGFHNKLGRLEKTFSCYTWLDDILFRRQNLAKCSSVIGNRKMCWPSVSSEPQRICKDKYCTKGAVFVFIKGIDGNVCINIIFFSTLTSFQT